MGNFLNYDGVSFNVDLVKQMTRKEFVTHPMHQNHYPRLNAEDKLKVLHAAYDLITGKSRSQKN